MSRAQRIVNYEEGNKEITITQRVYFALQEDSMELKRARKREAESDQLIRSMAARLAAYEAKESK